MYLENAVLSQLKLVHGSPLYLNKLATRTQYVTYAAELSTSEPSKTFTRSWFSEQILVLICSCPNYQTYENV